MSLPEHIVEKVRASFARQSLMTTFNASLLSIAPGVVRISAPITGDVRQQHGAAHAGLTFALGDTAAGYAALTQLDGPADVMTAEMKINLLRPATGASLTAEGRVLKAGQRLIVVQATVFTELEGKSSLIAALQGTMVPVTSTP